MHKPVLLQEVLSFLSVTKGKIYVDCTLGTGGHSLAILQRLGKEGTLIGIEQDVAALEIAKEKLKQFNNCYLFHSNFVELRSILNSLHIDKITGGVLLDLGVNSLQLDDPLRGFSFKQDGPLDMRMDQMQSLTAEKVLNSYDESKLAHIIYRYGEERFSRRISKATIQFRAKNEHIKTTKELASIVCRCYPKIRRYKIHPATKTFQAIRIEVNKELENLEKFLCFIPELLMPSSRLNVISFHSLEDRIIKNFLKKSSGEFKILTKKPTVPSSDEIDDNPRARSAKLRAAEKLI